MLSYEATELLILAAKSTISAQTMETVLTKLFHGDKDVMIINPSHVDVKNGSIPTNQAHFRRALAGATVDDESFYPCQPKQQPLVCTAVRAVSQTLIQMVPEEVRPSTRLINHDPGFGIRTDSYNYVVYVLLAFEMFCGSEPLGNLSKTTLQCLRYHYLCMCLKEKETVLIGSKQTIYEFHFKFNCL
ncbi:hypothetical protein PHMEG_0008767 [Phytophthora megakarya]|uniref:Uncharacterized protein n=1 Tax=Phytophthora megakarya TaxID=4795 RepID=A0A225WJK4_9STRA|nr:hypothetical protein PHMEG_0008767 [Phytophthora megakarya]